jgi:hypothetical protein
VSDRIQVGARERLLMPLCYLVMHLSYGAGWISGFTTEDTRQARRSIRHPAPDIHTPLSGELEEVLCVHSSALASLQG